MSIKIKMTLVFILGVAIGILGLGTCVNSVANQRPVQALFEGCGAAIGMLLTSLVLARYQHPDLFDRAEIVKYIKAILLTVIAIAALGECTIEVHRALYLQSLLDALAFAIACKWCVEVIQGKPLWR